MGSAGEEAGREKPEQSLRRVMGVLTRQPEAWWGPEKQRQ